MLLRFTRRCLSTSTANPIPTTVIIQPKPLSQDAQRVIDNQLNNPRGSLLSRFVNVTMKSGDKHQLMESEITEGLELLRRKTNQNPRILFEKAIELLAPTVECGSYKRGAKMLRVPLPVTQYRGEAYAMRWMKDSLRKKARPPVPFSERFSAEVLNILQGKSGLLQKKAQMHREALNNRSLSHFRWAVGYKM
jgi:small subunit ribosomal protein S7